ncbi:hypothetical protein GGS20DRAFT_599081 [Poronia punctata]|nr:hypothetical protein GGS20DRAFT_599081 [Poronia punctata]
MSLRLPSTLAILLAALRVQAFSFCNEDKCDNCPVDVTSEGTGYPDCAIYSVNDVFGNQGFDTKDNVVTAYLDVPQQNDEEPCYLLVKSPAHLQQPGCGLLQQYFHDATCGSVGLEDTFMIQFCCGRGDCSAAGVPNLPELKTRGRMTMPNSAKFGRRGDDKSVDMDFFSAASSGNGPRSMRISVNGTVIEPIAVGPPQVSPNETAPKLMARDLCEGNWTPQEGLEDYTRPADGLQIVSAVRTGHVTVTIEEARSQSWTTTIETSAGFNFEDIFSLGVSFSESFSESITNSEAAAYDIPKGQRGYVAWTSFLRCSTGSGTCNGQDIEGEVCTPYTDANSGGLAGTFSVVVEG